MSQSVMLKPTGIYTFQNHISGTPQGGLLVASNIVINRDSIAESRRGYAIYGNAMGSVSTNTAHQLLNYKNRLIRHWGTGAGQYLDYDNGSGTFTSFATSLSSTTHTSTTVDGLTSTAGLSAGMFVSGANIVAGTTISSITSNTAIVISVAATSSTTLTLSYTYSIQEVSTGTRIKSVEQNGNLYFTTSAGIQKVSALTASTLSSSPITKSGGIKALDLTGAIHNTRGFLSATSCVAYRVVWGIKDSNNNLILGTPSSRIIVRNPTGSSMTVDLTITIPKSVTTAYFYQIYRTPVITDAGTTDPGDEEQLAYEANPVAANLTAGYITVNDITPDSFLGAFLYTNENSGVGILQANDIPPLAYDICSFKGYTFYANTSTLQNIDVALLSIANFVSGTSTLTVSDGTTTNTYTFKTQTLACHTHTNTTVDNIVDTSVLMAGQSISGADFVAGTYIVSIDSATAITISVAATASNTTTLVAGLESVSSKYIAISQFPTPAQQVNETAQSLGRVINRQAGEIVYNYYISGTTDVPGQMLFEARGLSQAAFYLTVNAAASTGVEFNPALTTVATTPTTSTNEMSPNRIYYSKYQQPEAVPIVNYIDIGPKDKAIIRILALRDDLFILKEEGVYRLSGLTSPFTVYPFDFSTSVAAADSAVVLNNLIYMVTNQGVATVSSTGVAIISRPIEDQIVKLVSSQYTNFSTATFGVSYESDRAYYLFTVSATTDTYATQCFRFNTFTNSWTLLNLAKRSGIVNNANDKLYLAPTDTNYLEQERKSFDRTDYADREVALTLSTGAVNGTVITVPALTNISADDVVVQTQYLTLSQYNRLLTKLDNDAYLSPHNYVSTETGAAGLNLSNQLDLLIAKIRDDAGRAAVTGAVNGANQTVTITNATPAVFTNATNTTGYYNGMPILFTTTGALPSGLTASTIYYVSNLGTDGAKKFRVSATSGGSEIATGSAGSGTHTAKPAYTAIVGAGAASFSALQTAFNLLIGILNNDLGLAFKNYSTSSSTVDFEFHIVSTDTATVTITAPYSYDLIAGPITVYNHIATDLQFVPQSMGDVSMTKHVSEGTFIFESSAFTEADISYSTDLSANFEGDTIYGTGNGIFGNTPFGEGLFGGNGSSIPFRTYLPKNKQRARYVNCRFQHNIAREIFSLYGISLTFNPMSQRGWR